MKVYVFEGAVSDEALAAIKHYVINPVESREASLALRDTLQMEQPEPADVEVLEGFLQLDEAGLAAFLDARGLAMDLADIVFCTALLRRGRAQPHHHRDQDDRHLLVRPLPSHHVWHAAR